MLRSTLFGLAAGLVALCCMARPAEAAIVTYQFDWQGDAGYRATGFFSYDSATAPTIISESGAGSTNNLDSLSVQFFDPLNNPLQSFNTVAGGVSQSPFFQFNFDTSTTSLFGSFNVGGGTGVIGEQFFNGTVGTLLRLRQDVDQQGTSIELDRNSGAISVSPVVSAVPEPAALRLFALGLPALLTVACRRVSWRRS